MIFSTLHEHEIKAIQQLNPAEVTNYAGIPCLRYTGCGHFYDQQSDIFEKLQIVLHYTAGRTGGDIPELTKRGYKSVAFYITRTGRLIQFFNPDYWSYHLGPGAVGGNKVMSQRTIGIELQNFGWLDRVGDKLVTYFNTDYCTINDLDAYTIADFRGKYYWCKFTNAQYVTLKNLLTALTMQYKIPYNFLPNDLKFKVTSKVKTFTGITSHVNYRKDKWDIGPAFDWERIEQ